MAHCSSCRCFLPLRKLLKPARIKVFLVLGVGFMQGGRTLPLSTCVFVLCVVASRPSVALPPRQQQHVALWIML